MVIQSMPERLYPYTILNAGKYVIHHRCAGASSPVSHTDRLIAKYADLLECVMSVKKEGEKVMPQNTCWLEAKVGAWPCQIAAGRTKHQRQ